MQDAGILWCVKATKKVAVTMKHHGTHNALRTTHKSAQICTNPHKSALRTPPVHTYHAANHTTRNARAHVLRTFDTSFNVKCTRTWDSSRRPGSRTSTPREVPMLKCPDTNAAVWNVYLLLKPMQTGGPAKKGDARELRASQLRAGDRRGFDRGSSSSTGWCWVRATERCLCLFAMQQGQATGACDWDTRLWIIPMPCWRHPRLPRAYRRGTVEPAVSVVKGVGKSRSSNTCTGAPVVHVKGVGCLSVKAWDTCCVRTAGADGQRGPTSPP
jgi:hypothetical protein